MQSVGFSMGLSLQTLFILLILILESLGDEPNKMPIRLLKAGANLRPEFQNSQSGSEISLEDEAWSSSNEAEGEVEDYSVEAEGEGECGEGFYWHIRGSRCVPLRCGLGRTRDPVTGLCRVPYSPGSGSNGGYWPAPVRYYRSDGILIFPHCSSLILLLIALLNCCNL